MHAGWNRNIHYHHVVLSAVPDGCERALDVGCGAGRLTSELAVRCREVVGIDADAPALSHARAGAKANITFVHGDVMTHPFEEPAFDFITLVAALHHLPLDAALVRLRRLLRPRGVLVMIGLYKMSSISDFAWVPAALLVSTWHRMTHAGAPVAAPIRDPKDTLPEIRTAAENILPGAQVRRLLLFRYSLVWRKP